MAYRRRRSYRRRRYPRRSTGGTDYVRMAKMAYNGVRYLKGLVNVEKHALYSNGVVNPDSSSGILSCLNLIAQGDGEGARTGDSIMMKQLHVNFQFTINSSASNTRVRAIIFNYKQPQGATPVNTFVLQSATINALYNHDNAGLYTILYDRSVNLSNTGLQETTRMVTRKFYQLHEAFDGTSASVADIQRNALWLLLMSDEATNTPSVSWRSQLMYVDN